MDQDKLKLKLRDQAVLRAVKFWKKKIYKAKIVYTHTRCVPKNLGFILGAFRTQSVHTNSARFIVRQK
nr:unnamed protein product [Callosobruchus analis]